MNKVAVILAAGQGQKLNPLHTPKPLILVFGKPIILHQIEQLQEAGVEKIYIIIGSAKAGVDDLLRNSSQVKVKVVFIDQSDEASICDSFFRVAHHVKEDCLILSCDLIFEKNPYLCLSNRGDVEILIDKRVGENKFCGASIKINYKFFGSIDFDYDLPNFNAWCVGVYGFSSKGLDYLLELEKILPRDASFPQFLYELNKRYHPQITNLPALSWYDINLPETLIRAEMMLRKQQLSERPTQVRIDELKPINSSLSFTYSKSADTQIMIESGLIERVADYEIMPPNRVASQHVLITDEVVDKLFGDSVYKQMVDKGYKINKLIVPNRENAKIMSVYNELAEKIIALGIDEQTIIFALGGGAVANISGFLASTLYRGIGLVHIPTTIMNMIDVSISLKQGINGQKGKNLVGSYYQPLLVLIDPILNIPDWLVRDGISEAIKHAVCHDKIFFDFLLNFDSELSDEGFRVQLVKETVKLKIELMKEDMHEHYRGMILQYGHEIGHAVEFLSGFFLTHGQSISIGMRVSAELSNIMGIASEETVQKHKEIFKKYQLPYVIPSQIKPEAIIDSLKYNKKTRGAENVRVVLPEYIGKVWKVKGEYGIPCSVELIREAIVRSYK